MTFTLTFYRLLRFSFHSMSIIRKVQAVEKIFNRLDRETAALKNDTGMHCLAGCGRCCTKPDIEASPLEFLPLAFEWFSNGKAYEKLEELDQHDSAICMVFAPITASDRNGSCSQYKYRGLICRLFGYAVSRDKNGEKKLVTCTLIKQDQPKEYESALSMIAKKEYLPSILNYYQLLSQIDFKLANQMLPINGAIKVALQEVMQHYSYRPFPKSRKAG